MRLLSYASKRSENTLFRSFIIGVTVAGGDGKGWQWVEGGGWMRH